MVIYYREEMELENGASVNSIEAWQLNKPPSKVMDNQRFKSKLEQEEMRQAEKYLKLQHKRADGALRETSQSLFSNKKKSSKDNAGVIYGGEQVRNVDGGLAVTGKTAT